MRRLFVLSMLALSFGLLSGCAHTSSSADGKKDAEKVEVGYGSQDREDVTGSVGSVSSDDAARHKVTRVEDLLVGRVSGVNVYTTPNGIAVRVRGITSPNGNNEPLYVVDGIPVMPGPGGALVGISVNDIQSIDVLKGAAASIYGVRGANGVVVVKTKRGN